MDDNTLLDVYLDELKDMWNANEQMRDFVIEMADAAGNRRLSELLKGVITRLEARSRSIRELLAKHGEQDEPTLSMAMQGLVRQARDEALEKPLTEASRDVVIIARIQRMSHYCIAAYGTARALAEALGLSADAETLSTDLDKVYASDELLTHLAETAINPASAKEKDKDEEEDDEDDEADDFSLVEEKDGFDEEDINGEDEDDEDEGRLK
ncbi:YciE/YciF ferroxidase family protein [Pedomonas mirosovicensis]|uniref:YciE/YciF ferroxidase family protein n=1 Tax=Pedomonas mirosovicensis TaxID=2908641 RepID=UPI00216936A4|nr:DUF892 family protein [Pedomonas mirosovicensis]MCH8685840.1 DUF892 family protein [Pedomonas mirosovicensis]